MARVATELARKGVHVSMGGFAFALRWLTPLQAAALAAVALAFNILVLHRVTGRRLLRDGERASGFSTGIVLYPAVVLGLIVVFRERLELAAAVWLFLALGDGMATVTGVLIGGPKLPWNPAKSWAGLVGFVVYGTAGAVLVIPWTQRAAIDAIASGEPVHVGASFVIGASASIGFLTAGCGAAALLTALAESLDTGIDDNLIVPIVGGLSLYAATLVEPDRLIAALASAGVPFLIGAVVNLALAVAAFRARSVDRSGAVWGWILGTLLYTLADWRGFAMLVAFFVLGSVVTRTGYAKKRALGIAQERGGRRGARNAFANVSAGVLFAFLGVATSYPEVMAIGVAAAFAAAASDTVSSEIGQAYGRTHVMITSLRRVPAGTDGAISLEGTAAGAAAAAALGALGWVFGSFGPVGFVIVAVSGFAGNLLESLAGATFAGIRDIDNELVNFANTMAGGLIAVALAVAV